MSNLVRMSVFAILVWSVQIFAAPEYVGPGCDAEGKGCYFGRPSQRVQVWSTSGPTSKLGNRCELFIQKLNDKKNEVIAKSAPDFVLEFRNFKYNWVNRIDSEGRADIRCSVELHSENPKYLFVNKKLESYFWVCENQDDPGICRHTYAECEQKAIEGLADENVISTRMTFGASILQGQICYASALTIKNIEEE